MDIPCLELLEPGYAVFASVRPVLQLSKLTTYVVGSALVTVRIH